MSKTIDYIEPIRISEHVTYFYWGRHPDHPVIDMRLGGGGLAVHRGKQAILVDTMNVPEEAVWMREYLSKKCGVREFRVINTHWHADHIGGNAACLGDPIIAHRRTRELMIKHAEALEAGTLWSHPPIPVVPPGFTIEDRADLWLGDYRVEVHRFEIHEEGHLAVYLPAERLLLAGDMLEDPLWALNLRFASPELQLAEYERMKQMDIERIVPVHSTRETILAGGYDKRIIDANAAYLRGMLAAADEPDFLTRPAADFIRNEIQRGVLTWWEPYTEVHEYNKAAVSRAAGKMADRTRKP